MWPRLTNIWPGLLTRQNRGRDEELEPLLVDEDQMKELEVSTLLKFKNLYWTRVISMDNFLPKQQQRYEMGPDVALEVDNMYRLDIDRLPAWIPHFDPVAFQQQHKDIKLTDWKLEEPELQAWATRAIEI